MGMKLSGVTTYLKSILVGAAAFVVAVLITGVIAIAITIRLPELAMRIFPAQRYDIQWGAFYSPYFPFWQIVIIGLLAFVIAFAWMLRRAPAKT
jgi:hypothetical protein